MLVPKQGVANFATCARALQQPAEILLGTEGVGRGYSLHACTAYGSLESC